MKSLFILIALVIFGALLGVFSSIGVGPTIDLPWIPNSDSLGVAANSAANGVTDLEFGSIISVAGTCIETLVTSLTAVLFLASILVVCGVPLPLAIAIQAIIYIVYLWDLIPFVWGRVVR